MLESAWFLRRSLCGNAASEVAEAIRATVDHVPTGFRRRDRNRFRVDIETDKSYVTSRPSTGWKHALVLERIEGPTLADRIIQGATGWLNPAPAQRARTAYQS